MIRVVLTMLLALTALPATRSQASEYIGICEASAGAFLDDRHFAVASDETNVLQLYERGKPGRIGGGIDLTGFTTFDKSDLEGAAVVGDRVYWISSHSFNGQREDKAKRKVFFATRITQANGRPTLTGIGKPFKTLRDPLAKALNVKPGELNIESLAATPDGGLIIGLRAPLRVVKGETRAIAIVLKNPAAVVDQGSAPEFGSAFTLGLGGRGLRSMDLIGTGSATYVIVAGPVADTEGFAVYRWAGPGTEPVLSEPQPDLSGLTPESAMAVPGQKMVQLLSDDGWANGTECSDEKHPIHRRKFRSIDVSP